MSLTDEEIRAAYRNPKTGLTGLNLFAKHIGEDVERVKKVLLSEDPYTLNKNTVRNFPRKLTYSPHFFNQLQIDLMDVSPWSAQNNGIKFLFIAIDVFSRYVWVYPIKNKSAETVLDCLKELIASEHKIPKYIQTDQGKEFFNTTMNKFCAENDIIHFHTYTEIKCALAERFIRTLRMRLTRLWDIRGTFHYLDVLPEIIEGYNNGYHSTLKTTPTEAIVYISLDQGLTNSLVNGPLFIRIRTCCPIVNFGFSCRCSFVYNLSLIKRLFSGFLASVGVVFSVE